MDAPLDEVFAWHSRAGALARLLPPWQPISVVEEAGSLRDGRAVLGLPGGIKWVAQHRPDRYDPPHRFTDELTSFPFRSALHWEHTHEFAAPVRRRRRSPTRSTPTCRTAGCGARSPTGTRQLAGDLGAHRRGHGFQGEPLRIAVTGSSGLIGTALTAFLRSGGHQVIRLVRRLPPGPTTATGVPKPLISTCSTGSTSSFTSPVRLSAAASPPRHKGRIRASRIEPTAALARVAALAAASGRGPACFISASAIGIYGVDRGDQILTEASSPGEGFLAGLVTDWEAATAPAEDAGVRVVQIRTGLVQSPGAGRCGCCCRCSQWASAAGWAPAGNGHRGSASTI